jgi:hypothetical protein
LICLNPIRENRFRGRGAEKKQDFGVPPGGD